MGSKKYFSIDTFDVYFTFVITGRCPRMPIRKKRVGNIVTFHRRIPELKIP